jgi:hypothetical protein
MGDNADELFGRYRLDAGPVKVVELELQRVIKEKVSETQKSLENSNRTYSLIRSACVWIQILLSVGAFDFSHVDSGVRSGVARTFEFFRFSGVLTLGVALNGVVLRVRFTVDPKAELIGGSTEFARRLIFELYSGGASTEGRRAIEVAMRLTLRQTNF